MKRRSRHDALERRDMGDLTLAILLFDDVEVLDFAGPFEVFSVTAGLLEDRRLKVSTVAESQGEIRDDPPPSNLASP